MLSTKQLTKLLTEVTRKLQTYFGVTSDNRSIDLKTGRVHDLEKLLNRPKCVDNLIFQSETIEVLWWHKVSFGSW
jgi:hypothetical protein